MADEVKMDGTVYDVTCDGCKGERHRLGERRRYDVHSRQWLCPECFADARSWCEDMDECLVDTAGVSRGCKDNTPMGITP